MHLYSYRSKQKILLPRLCKQNIILCTLVSSFFWFIIETYLMREKGAHVIKDLRFSFWLIFSLLRFINSNTLPRHHVYHHRIHTRRWHKVSKQLSIRWKHPQHLSSILRQIQWKSITTKVRMEHKRKSFQFSMPIGNCQTLLNQEKVYKYWIQFSFTMNILLGGLFSCRTYIKAKSLL